MLKEKKTGKLIVISGPSGVGKDTICKKLVEETSSLNLSVSMTSRKQRGEEKEGIDYYFVSRDEFEERIQNNIFIEYAIIHNGEYYGTPKDKIYELLNQGKDIILEINIEGALKIKELMPQAILIFLLAPSMRELKERLIKRGTETREGVLERFKTAYTEIKEMSKYNYVVINDVEELAVKEIQTILAAEKLRVDRIEDLDLNTQEELINEISLDKRLTLKKK